ncbi:MAG: 2,3-bisphosphoglycerate-independent phosphoglycerate mutase [Gammaproteobacteria bacterium]|nr:2,3-bisphosphoglycerate-independent phosphoglycerate mutase [Gammaproteobacteria bacterium]
MKSLLKNQRPLVLVVLDGWGLRSEREHNAIALADTPMWDKLWRDCPRAQLEANGEAVGLPAGQMGNSEVGHLTIGAGRIIEQDLVRINHAIESGEFFHNPVLLAAIDKAAAQNTTFHIVGLLSPGGVHSHQNHLMAGLELASARGVKKICLHAILDGRDCPPKSAAESIAAAAQWCESFPGVEVASVIGRFYAMDRDQRWDRTAAAYQLYTAGKAQRYVANAAQALKQAYADGESDYFVTASAIANAESDAQRIKDGDSVAFFNFRADRIRQIVAAMTDKDFDGFERQQTASLADVVCLTEYDKRLNLPVIFSPLHIENGLGQCIADADIEQLRLAETEKYAHVSYFLNGGLEQPWPLEQRVMIPSPKVTSYDQQPEMSAYEVTNILLKEIANKRFGVIVCNYANGDLVGHSGNFKASVKAVGVVDQCLARIVNQIKTQGGELLITADHGNVEDMFNEQTQQARTSHTLNPVPFIYVGDRKLSLKDGGLADVAPTMLALLGLSQPELMTGQSLIR